MIPAKVPAKTPVTVTTLRVRTEIRRQLTRRRTRLTFAFLVGLPLVLMLAFQLGSDDSDDGPSFIDMATSGAANFAVFTLVVSATFLLIVVVALFCGDTVASEASWGSLRYLLAVPVPRSRLLAVKLVVSLLSSLVALVLLTATAYVIGTLAFGWHALRTPLGEDIAAGRAVWHVAGMVGYLAVTLLVIAALAFLLSVSTDAPLAAVGGAVMVFIVSEILDQVDALGDVRSLLPTHYFDAWQGLFSEPVQFDGMAKGAVSAVAYAAVFLALAWWRFHRKDVLS